MNKRRNFLQQLGLLSAGVAFAPALLTSCNTNSQNAETVSSSDASAEGNATGTSKPTIQNIGIQLYTLRELLPNDVKGVISKVSQAGYQDVETYGYSVKDGYWGLEPKAFRELLDANNLVSSSGHYDFNQYTEDGNTDIVKRYIEAANVVGHTYLTFPWLREDLRDSLDDYKRLVERVNKAAELCKAGNLKLAYHNHDFEFHQFEGGTGYDILLNETDPALVSFEADLFWMEKAGKKPVDMFKQHEGRFVMWHVKDMDKNSPDLNTEVGSGSINYQEIFSQAKLSGLDKIFIEQENFAAGMDPFQSIKQSRDYVRNTLLA